MTTFNIGDRIRVVRPNKGNPPPSWLIGLIGEVKSRPYAVREFDQLSRTEEVRTYYQVQFEKVNLRQHTQTSYTLREAWLVKA